MFALLQYFDYIQLRVAAVGGMPVTVTAGYHELVAFLLMLPFSVTSHAALGCCCCCICMFGLLLLPRGLHSIWVLTHVSALFVCFLLLLKSYIILSTSFTRLSFCSLEFCILYIFSGKAYFIK